MGVSSAIRSYLLSARGLLQGLNRFDLEAVTVVADRGLLLILGTLVLMSGFGLLGLSIAFVVARLLMFVVVTLIVQRVTGSARPTYDRAVWAELQTAALPLGFFLITLTLYTYIDTVILGIMRTDAETGWYAASYRVYEGLMYAPSALATVLTPRFSQLFVDDPKGLRAMFTRSLAGSAAMAVLVGGAAVFLARFLPPVRAFVPITAGALGMAPGRFFPINIVAILCWAPAHVVPGMLAGEAYGHAGAFAGHLTMPIIAGIVAAAILVWAIRRWMWPSEIG